MKSEPSLSINQIIIYLRKSRSDDPSLSVEEVLASHECHLQEYASNAYGGTIPEDHIYREVVSGETIADRPVMQRVLELIESESIRGVLVIEPQRLSRGDMEDCGRLINLFRYSGTLVLTPMISYDLNDEYDRKFFEMELTRGNDYLEYTKRILLRGRVASVKRGNYIASVPPYGYRKVVLEENGEKFHTLEPVPEEADAVRMIFRLYADDGMGFQSIAHYLDDMHVKPRKSGHWNPAALKDILDNPVYIGKIRWNWRKTKKTVHDGEIVKVRPKSQQGDYLEFPGKHPAIIDEDLFHRAHDTRGTRPRIHRNAELSNPLAGLLFCSCGTAMSMKRYVSRRSQTGHVIVSMVCNDQTHCHTKSVLYDALLERLITILRQSVEDFRVLLRSGDDNAASGVKEQLRLLENDLARLHQKDARQKDAYENGIYTMEEYATRNAKLQEQIQHVEERIAGTRKAAVPVVDYREKIVKFQSCIDALLSDDVSVSDKNRLLKECVSRITYHNAMPSIAGIGRHVENQFDIDVSLRI